MPSGAGTPNKNSLSNARQPESAVAPPSTGEPQSQDSSIQAPTPKRIERRRRPSRKTQPSDIPVLEQQPQTESLTPTPAMEQTPATIPLSNSDSAAVTGRKSRNKKVANKQQANGNASPSVSIPRNSRSPRPEPGATSMTPVKKGTTQSQAYAGPTFHASPAPSALPIPKFFSKSVPVTEKGASLSTMMQEDSSEGLSNKSDDSPIMQNSLRVSQRSIREASPLDFFFNADREEKAKRSSVVVTGGSNQIFDQVAGTPKSVSPIPEHMRHHSRNATGGSMHEIFPLEMDASEKLSPIRAMRPLDPSTEARRPESSPSTIRTRSTKSEEQAKAKTEALKRFLLSPQPQSPSSKLASPLGYLDYSSSPSPSPLPHHNHYLRSTSATSIPRGSAGSPAYTHHTQLPVSNVPYLQQSPTTKVKGLSQERPLSSQLRREMTANMFPEPKELPSTTTPSHSHNVFNQTATQNGDNVQHNSNFSPYTPAVKKFRPEDALKAATGQMDTSVDMMENELRRILKLDSLGSGGAAGVRS
ncbi:hypothetical protein MMC11_008351 [Xylographa trunciseda]|nr:hypothetical protein [Xylographa trunciseda]